VGLRVGQDDRRKEVLSYGVKKQMGASPFSVADWGTVRGLGVQGNGGGGLSR